LLPTGSGGGFKPQMAIGIVFDEQRLSQGENRG
jgi:hypothetical protein